MTSTPEKYIGLPFSYLFLPHVSGFRSARNGLLVRCSPAAVTFFFPQFLWPSQISFLQFSSYSYSCYSGGVSPEILQENIYERDSHMRAISYSQLKAKLISL